MVCQGSRYLPGTKSSQRTENESWVRVVNGVQNKNKNRAGTSNCPVALSRVLLVTLEL